uniref:Uncharacterized protein n=1 Tax=Emiliania huxleyi TaxID=2903 RepID=A0A7S3RT59_EMIHU
MVRDDGRTPLPSTLSRLLQCVSFHSPVVSAPASVETSVEVTPPAAASSPPPPDDAVRLLSAVNGEDGASLAAALRARPSDAALALALVAACRLSAGAAVRALVDNGAVPTIACVEAVGAAAFSASASTLQVAARGAANTLAELLLRADEHLRAHGLHRLAQIFVELLAPRKIKSFSLELFGSKVQLDKSSQLRVAYAGGSGTYVETLPNLRAELLLDPLELPEETLQLLDMKGDAKDVIETVLRMPKGELKKALKGVAGSGNVLTSKNLSRMRQFYLQCLAHGLLGVPTGEASHAAARRVAEATLAMEGPRSVPTLSSAVASVIGPPSPRYPRLWDTKEEGHGLITSINKRLGEERVLTMIALGGACIRIIWAQSFTAYCFLQGIQPTLSRVVTKSKITLSKALQKGIDTIESQSGAAEEVPAVSLVNVLIEYDVLALQEGPPRKVVLGSMMTEVHRVGWGGALQVPGLVMLVSQLAFIVSGAPGQRAQLLPEWLQALPQQQDLVDWSCLQHEACAFGKMWKCWVLYLAGFKETSLPAGVPLYSYAPGYPEFIQRVNLLFYRRLIGMIELLYASTIDSFMLAFIDPCGGQLSMFYKVRDAIAMSTGQKRVYSDVMMSSDLYKALQVCCDIVFGPGYELRDIMSCSSFCNCFDLEYRRGACEPWTIFIGCDFVLSYFVEGELVTLDKRTIMKAEMAALAA